METKITINATVRSPKKKGANRQLRRQGLVPAIFYGPKREPQPITVSISELREAISSGQEGQFLIQLHIKDNGSSHESTVMIKDFQVDPVRRELLHADFYEVDLNKPLLIEVALLLTGRPVGLEAGGILQQIQRSLMISALPHEIPEQIEVDVSELDVGDSVRVSDIEPPAGVKVEIDGGATIAIVSLPKGALEEVEEAEAEEEVAEEAAAEGEPAPVSEEGAASED